MKKVPNIHVFGAKEEVFSKKAEEQHWVLKAYFTPLLCCPLTNTTHLTHIPVLYQKKLLYSYHQKSSHLTSIMTLNRPYERLSQIEWETISNSKTWFSIGSLQQHTEEQLLLGSFPGQFIWNLVLMLLLSFILPHLNGF